MDISDIPPLPNGIYTKKRVPTFRALFGTGEFEFYADEHEKILRIPVSSDSKGKITLSLSDPKLCYIDYQSTWQVDVDIEQRNSFFSIKRLARQKVPEGNEGSARVKQYIVTRHGSDESDEKVEWEVEGTGIYAASETDFKNNSLPSGILAFAPGESEKIIEVSIKGDNKFENDESFSIKVSNKNFNLPLVVHSTKASRYGQEYSYDWQRSHGILSYINTDGGVTSNARLLDDSSGWRETLGYNSSSGEFIDNSDSLREGVTKIFTLDYAFAALKLDGSVVLWTYRPNSTGNRDLNFNPNSLKGKKIQDDVVDVIKGNFNGTPYIRFYALKSNGTVVTGSDYNRQTLRVADEYNGLLHNYEDSFLKRGPLSLVDDAVKIIPDYYNGGLINGHYYNEYPPIVIREGGILQTMGARYHLPPGNYHDVAINDWGFTAINNDGDVYAWERGRVEPVLADIGTVPANIVSSQYSNIRKVSVSKSAFAGLTKSGSVITWGSNSHGGDSTSVNHQLNEGVVDIVASADSFAAIKKDGSVVTWGGGSSDTSQVASSLVDGVISISSNSNAFAALKSDGSVVAWGSPIAGGNTSNVVTKIDGGVRRILGSDGYRSIGSGGFAPNGMDLSSHGEP